jgi:hypothetical protein
MRNLHGDWFRWLIVVTTVQSVAGAVTVLHRLYKDPFIDLDR